MLALALAGANVKSARRGRYVIGLFMSGFPLAAYLRCDIAGCRCIVDRVKNRDFFIHQCDVLGRTDGGIGIGNSGDENRVERQPKYLDVARISQRDHDSGDRRRAGEERLVQRDRALVDGFCDYHWVERGFVDPYATGAAADGDCSSNVFGEAGGAKRAMVSGGRSNSNHYGTLGETIGDRCECGSED